MAIMTRQIIERHRRAPSAIAFMASAVLPSPGLGRDSALPSLVQRWEGLRIKAGHLAAFRRACGLGEEHGISVLYPHVFGFRLQMALLTHRAYPLPIWSALQVRNRLVRHCHFHAGERLDLETSIGAHRAVDKGIEIDLRSRLLRGTTCCWESEVTYFYRGRYGSPAVGSAAAAPTLAEAPVVERFGMPRGGGWRFGSLTGDYNGIHWATWYARRLGFRAAFLHPQRVVGMCMARLRGPESEAQSLQLWIRGPLFYGANVSLRAATDTGGVSFGLSLDGDDRFALLGQWQGVDGAGQGV
jgi:hypothetical protein